jgi:HEAT repeat protein
VPALRGALDATSSPSVRSAVLLAQARIGGGLESDELGRSQVEQTLLEHLADTNQRVAESACIGLGILARPASLGPLTALLNDTDEGRKLFGRSAVTRRMGAFAAYGIGLIGQRSDNEDVRRYATHVLSEVLAQDAEPAPDRRVACVIALGLIAPGGRDGEAGSCTCSSNDALAAQLLELLRNKRAHDLLRAQVPPTLAHLAAYTSTEAREKIVHELIKTVGKRKEKDAVHQGAALALGLIGDADDDELDRKIRGALMSAAVDRNRMTKSLALVALAQVSTRPGTDDSLEASAEARSFLLRRLTRGKSNERTWSMLALGLLGRGLVEEGVPLDRVQLDAMRTELEDSRSPDEAAACAIAAGLIRDRDSVAALLEKVADLHQGERGMAALGLGMTGDPRAVEPLTEVLGESLHEPEVLEQTSISLELLRDPARVTKILALLEECDCILSQRGAAFALGRSRHEDAVEPLLAMLGSQDGPEIQRAFAAVGLALLAERDGRPWSTRLSFDLHYRANPATLTDPSGSGILDLP